MTVAVFALPEHRAAAKELADALAVPALTLDRHDFPDGEFKLTLGGIADVAIVHMTLDRPNDKLVALLLASEALRRNGARRLVLVAPYLCYMRQDIAFHPLEAISQKVLGRLLAPAFDRIVTVDAHLHRTATLAAVFPGIEADDLTATGVLAEALVAAGVDPRSVIVGPDVESEPWVRSVADRLGLAHAVGRKTRRGDRDVAVVFDRPEEIAGCPVVLVDDVIASGGTLLTAAAALRAAGATSIDVVATHALWPPEMDARFAEAGIRSLRSTTSVPHPSNVVSLTPLLAAALRREVVGA